MAFQIPLHFEDLTRPTTAPWTVTPLSQRDSPSDHLLLLLDDEIQTVLLDNNPPSHHLTSLYTLITRYRSLTAEQRRSLVNLLLALSAAATQSDPTHIKLSLFLLSGFAVTASAVTPPCKFWDKTGRESVLEAAYTLISSSPTPATFSASDREQLASLLVRTLLHVLESPTAARHRPIRPLLARLLDAALTLDDRQTLPATSALLHALTRHEHLPPPLAQILATVVNERPSHEQFVAHLIREIARLPADMLVRDVAASKSLAAFISDLAELMPSLFRSNLAMLLSQLDVDSYTFRNGVVHVIGVLIRDKPDADDPLLQLLLQRAHRDVNAFTRSKAMQVWINLVENAVVPNRLFPSLADMAASRLDDRTAAVRKYATQLLGALLKHNPFGPALKINHFSEKYDEMCKLVPDEDKPGDESADVSEIASEDDSENSEHEEDGGQSDENLARRQESDVDTTLNQENDADGEGGHANENTDDGNDVPMTGDKEESTVDRELIVKKRFYKCAVDYIRAVQVGLETVYNMLRSKSITDVAEAVSLLVTAIQFQIESGSSRTVRKMLPLVLARENNVREKVTEAYVRLLAPGGVDGLDEKEAAMAVAKGLTALGIGSTTGELACLEALITALCSGKNDARVITPAVIAVLWDLLAGRVPGASDEQRRTACMFIAMIAKDRPESLLQRVDILESTGLVEPSLTRWSCVALCNLPPGSDADGRLCNRLTELARSSTDLSIAEQALNGIFVLAPEPEAIASKIIHDLAEKLQDNAVQADVKVLSRFLLVVGHVAVRELVRIESLVSQLRKASSERRTEEDNEEEEQAGAEAEKALELAEKELVSPNSLLGRYGQLAQEISADINAPTELRASAVLCLSKLMCVQKKFCERNLRLLFSLVASSTDAMIRANAVTALGDLTFRFPNLIEPWTSHIYGWLSDENEKVRKTTLMVLTHLILNDMIKVKGQIVGMAICILDKDERIADLARLFFHELARKSSNAIYNILPDTISCISNKYDLKQDEFKQVVGFLVALMDKEKHADGMVEKLCHRFRSSESERENRDLAYCVAQLKMSERGLKKLNEKFKSFSAALIDDEVHEWITQAISKGAKSSSAGSLLQVVEELQGKISVIRKAAGKDGAEEVESCGTGEVENKDSGQVGAGEEGGECIERVEETNERATRGASRGRRGARGGGRRGRGQGCGGATRSTRSRRIVESDEESADDVVEEDDDDDSDGDGSMDDEIGEEDIGDDEE